MKKQIVALVAIALLCSFASAGQKDSDKKKEDKGELRIADCGLQIAHAAQRN